LLGQWVQPIVIARTSLFVRHADDGEDEQTCMQRVEKRDG
jgi:hypothetical protein